jgi:hypothetical protein
MLFTEEKMSASILGPERQTSALQYECRVRFSLVTSRHSALSFLGATTETRTTPLTMAVTTIAPVTTWCLGQ